jgi:hypothetical protein
MINTKNYCIDITNNSDHHNNHSLSILEPNQLRNHREIGISPIQRGKKIGMKKEFIAV